MFTNDAINQTAKRDSMNIDETHIAIMKLLKDGRRSFKKIAEELSITENTVRARVRRLQEEGVLDVTGLVNPESLKGHRVVIVGMNISHVNLVEKGEEISKLKGVVSVSVVTGRYDLIVQVLFKEGYGLLEFYTEELSQVKDIQSVETFVVYKGYNLKVPYLL